MNRLFNNMSHNIISFFNILINY